jgi:hypothetical protein
MKIEELLQAIKPYVIGWQKKAIAESGDAAHALSGPLHTGQLADDQAPQFILRDGSRSLTGNLAVVENVTIDGVDVSAFKSVYDGHLLADSHTIYASADGAGTRSAYQAERLNRSILAGSGLTGGGLLTADRTLAVDFAAAAPVAVSLTAAAVGVATKLAREDHRHALDVSISPTWSGDHIFNGAVTFNGTISGISLDEIAAPAASKTFNMANKSLAFSYTNPSGAPTYDGAFEIEATGAFVGDLVHIHQHTGNPGVTDLLHLESVDTDVLPLKINGTGATITEWYNGASLLASLSNAGLLKTGHHYPMATDTYDLGSSSLLWRKIYASEFDTVLFAANTVTLLGGWLIVGKDEGVLPAAVAAADTKINFGKAVALNSFVVFRGLGQVEYMKVLTLSSGTTYDVTRNLDGSGANDWPAGAPFWVIGVNGDGWIEANAYDTPRINIWTQGATYNAKTELMRLGDLNGNWGYSTATYGAAFGEYATGKGSMTWDPTNGLRLLSGATTVIQLDQAGNADILGKLRLPGTGSALAIGATPPTAANAGTGLWLDRTGFYSLASNVYQVKIDAADGKLYAGAGVVILDVDGATIVPSTTYAASRALKFSTGGTTYSQLYSVLTASENGLFATAAGASAHDTRISVTATGYTGRASAIELIAVENSTEVRIDILSSSVKRAIELTAATYVSTSHDLRVGRGLYVGGTGTAPGDNNVEYEGDLRKLQDGSLRTGYIFVPLTTPKTSTDWDGDVKNTGTYDIDSSASPWSLPAGVKAIVIRLAANWGAANSGYYAALRPNGQTEFTSVVKAYFNGYVEMTAVVPVDSNGDFEVVIGGANTTGVYLQLWGYYV